MTLDILILILVSASALAFIIQCVSLWLVARTAKQIAQRVEKRTEAIDRQVQELMAKGHEIKESLDPLIYIGQNINNNVQQISELLKKRTQDVDQFLTEVMEIGRRQASKIDYVVTDTVHKFEQTTEVIQADVLKPAVELSSFFKGLKSGLNYLFARSAQGGPDQ
ncbi:MAG: hypothetical protein ACRD1R_09265 [Acidobacteriota bacterium]